MVLITPAKKMVGESSGTVMRQNRVQGPAPSMRAASRSSSGTDCNPADMMMKDRPRNCQMVSSATAGRAQVELSSAGGGGLMPSQGSSPPAGLSRVPNPPAATATELTTVEEKTSRYAAIPLSLRCAATARPSPASRLIGPPSTTKNREDT